MSLLNIGPHPALRAPLSRGLPTGEGLGVRASEGATYDPI